MLNKQNVKILGALLFGSLVVFWLFVLAHPSFQICVAGVTDRYQIERQRKGHQATASIPFLQKYFSCASAVARHDSDSITALATSLLTVITLGLVFLGIEQSKTTRAQLRAYVFVSGTSIFATDQTGNQYIPRQPIRDGTKPASHLQITNSGQTPAYDVRIYGRMDFVSWPIIESDLSSLVFNNPVSKSSFGPGGGNNKFDTLAEDRILQQPDQADLMEGRKVIVVHGEIRYLDVFGIPRWTKYRWFTGGPVGIRGIELVAHDDGNDAN